MPAILALLHSGVQEFIIMAVIGGLLLLAVAGSIGGLRRRRNATAALPQPAAAPPANQDAPARPPQPWDFQPLTGFRVSLGCLGAIVLFLLMLYAVIGVVVAPIVMLTETSARPSSPGAMIGKIALWLLVVALAIVFTRGFVKLNRRVNLSRKLAECPPESAYVLGGSLLRSFSGVGDVRFQEGSLFVWGTLGPNLLWPLLVIMAVNVVSAIAALSGGSGILIGGLGMIIILAIYNGVLRAGGIVKVAPGSISAVYCKGPVVWLYLRPKPVAGLRTVRILLPEPRREAFFRTFDAMFPGKLPHSYREALYGLAAASTTIVVENT